MAAQVDDSIVYEPDALVRRGRPLADDAMRVIDPLIVVEVVSPSSRGRDSDARLADCFRIVTLRHYLIARTDDRPLIHHERTPDGEIMTRIIRDGRVDFGGGLVLSEALPAA